MDVLVIAALQSGERVLGRLSEEDYMFFKDPNTSRLDLMQRRAKLSQVYRLVVTESRDDSKVVTLGKKPVNWNVDLFPYLYPFPSDSGIDLSFVADCTRDVPATMLNEYMGATSGIKPAQPNEVPQEVPGIGPTQLNSGGPRAGGGQRGGH